MTNEEALQFQAHFLKYQDCYSDRLIEASKIAVLAIEKQIPKKPMHGLEDKKPRFCPSCRKMLSSSYTICGGVTYCEKCGQALDWGDSKVLNAHGARMDEVQNGKNVKSAGGRNG